MIYVENKTDTFNILTMYTVSVNSISIKISDKYCTLENECWNTKEYA